MGSDGGGGSVMVIVSVVFVVSVDSLVGTVSVVSVVSLVLLDVVDSDVDELDDELAEVVLAAVVARVLPTGDRPSKSMSVTSGRSARLVGGRVDDCWTEVEEGKTSNLTCSSGPRSRKAATTARATISTSGTTLFTATRSSTVPSCPRQTLHTRQTSHCAWFRL